MLPRLTPVVDHRALFLGRYERLLSRARTLLGSRVDFAQDLVHEAFVQFITREPPLDAIDDLDAYLHGMVRYLHLSRVRRAGRYPMLQVADFDSVLVGLHGTDGSARIHALHELAHLCRYASVRKDSSPTASVLILRFFWGFAPPAVARLAHTSTSVVAQRLRRARLEAKTYLASPRRLEFMRQQELPPLVAFDPTAPIHETCAHALAAIVRTRRGPCLTHEDITALYASVDIVPTTTLAHLASCHACLDRAARHLGIDRDEGLMTGGGWTEDDLMFPSVVEDGRPVGRASHERRRTASEAWLNAVRHHRPTELHLFANGFLVGSQRVAGSTNELSVPVHIDEPLTFVEVVTEQGVLLLIMGVEPPFTGDAHPEAQVALGDGRTVRASVDFSDMRPRLRCWYTDPMWTPEPAPATGLPDIDPVDAPADAAAPDSRGLRSLFGGRWTTRAVVWRFAFALVVCWLLFGGGASTVAAAAGRVWRWVSHVAADVMRSPVSRMDAPLLPSRPMTIAPLGLRQALTSVPVSQLVLSERATSSTPSTPSTPTETELIDLEVQALQRLDRIDALLGEQVACTRTRDQLRVSVVVDDPARASTVRAALAPLAGDRRVVLRVDTAHDLVTRAASRGAGAGAVAVRQYTVEADTSAMHQDLRAYVARTAPDKDAAGLADAEHELARRVVDTSHRALRQTWALRRLVEAFTVAQVSTMSAPSSATWHDLIATHIRAYRQELRELTRVLTTVVPAPADAARGDEERAAPSEGQDPAVLLASLRRLLACAAEVDEAVQRSFRSSRSDVEAPASVKTTAFWRTLAEARRLAASVGPSGADRDP